MSEKTKGLSAHKDKLERLVCALKGISPTHQTVKSIEVVVRNLDGTSQEVTFDTNDLDTFLLFTNMSEFAQYRAEHLAHKIKEMIEK